MKRLRVPFLVAILIGCVTAQDPTPPAPESKPGDTATSESRPSSRPRRRRAESRAAEAKAETRPAVDSPFTAIVDATIWPVSGPPIRRGTVLVFENRILDVGRDIPVPEGAKIIDGKGKHVAPGFIALRSLQTFGGGFMARGEDSPGDQADPYNIRMLMALSAGITTAFEGGSPSPTGNLAGFIGKHTYGTLDGLAVKDKAALWVTYASTEPLRGPFGGDPIGPAGPSDQSAKQTVRDLLKRAVEFRKARAKFIADPAGGKAPTADENVTAFARALDGEIPVFIRASSRSELAELARLSEEFNLPVIVTDATEAWASLPDLARGRFMFMLNPRQRPSDGAEPRNRLMDEPTGWRPINPAALEKAGYTFAVQPLSPSISTDGLPGRDLMALPMEACFAIRGGASEEAGLASITLAAAKILKIDDRVGSIDAGKDADLLVMDREPLDYRSFAEIVLVNGKVVYEKDKVSLFNHVPTDRSTPLRGNWWRDR